MVKASRRRGAFERLLGHFWFGLGALSLPAAPERAATCQVEDEHDEALAELLSIATDVADPALAGHRLAVVLDQIDPFEATRIAALGAISESPSVRRALAEALVWDFPLVGADMVLEHLASDRVGSVRAAVARAAHTRRAALDDSILLRLSVDSDPAVADTAAFAIGCRRS